MKYPVIFGTLTAAFTVGMVSALAEGDNSHARSFRTATPIKHLVVIFQENVSFDHYFGTYPTAANLPGDDPWHASPKTPTSINNLVTPLDTTKGFVPLMGVDLINNNPNNNPNAPGNGSPPRFNGAGAANPFRLSPAQAATNDQGHNESPEESAYDNTKMDGFPAWVGTAGPPPAGVTTKGLVMGYFDGNTVTALWNYAQYFALNDNSYTSQFGPSTPGAINLIAGQLNGFSAMNNNVVDSQNHLIHPTHEAFADSTNSSANLTMIGDADPLYDVCSNGAIDQVQMAGRNVGDLLNLAGVTWGWFEGGFNLTITNSNGTTGCALDDGDGAGHSVNVHRLYSPPPAVPILRVDEQSDPCAPGLGRGNRPQCHSRHP
jgi:phospholipase C